MTTYNTNGVSNQLAEILAEEIRNSIDSEIVWHLMVEMNSSWIPVIIENSKSIDWDEFTSWLIENFGDAGNDNSRYLRQATPDEMRLLFENEQDAIMTVLRWK